MKVSFLVACLTHGGAEKVASLWINGFVERGYEVSCIIMSEQSPISYSISGKVNVYKVGPDGQGIKHNINQIRKIRSFLKEIKPEILITILHPLGLFGYVASIGLGIKVINTEHNTFDRPDYAPFSRMDIVNKYYINKFFKRVTVFTHADISYIGKRLNNVVYLPNPLSMQPVTTIPSKKQTILAVGRMEAWHVKGFDLLIKAWGAICKKYPGWKLQLLGGGDYKYRDYLIDLSKKSGACDNMEIIDFCSDPQVFYQDASIFVLSSRYEGFGMALLEAMSQGCACIACDYKGRQSEILASHECGIICESNNEGALVNAITYMIDNQEYRESIRVNAIKRSGDFSLSKIMDRWEEIIKEIN